MISRSACERTVSEELLIDKKYIESIEFKESKREIGISNKSTFRFLQTESHVFSANVQLNCSKEQLKEQLIIYNGEIFIFFTPEYENGKIKRVTVWYLSDNNENMQELVDILKDDRDVYDKISPYFTPVVSSIKNTQLGGSKKNKNSTKKVKKDVSKVKVKKTPVKKDVSKTKVKKVKTTIKK